MICSNKVRHGLVFLLIFVGSSLQAQEYIYISRSGIREILRVNAAYTNMSISANDTATKSAHGLHLLNEVKIISGRWDKKKALTFHDAFYFDINFGRMSDEPRTANPGGAKVSGDETRFSVSTNFGYLGLVGYRNKTWAALAGLDFRWNRVNIGKYNMPNLGSLFSYTRPFVLRGEYCLSKSVADKRAIAMVWFDGGSATRAKYFSIRLEYPLGDGGRWWLFTQFSNLETTGDDLYKNIPFNTGNLKQFNLGFRIQNAIL